MIEQLAKIKKMMKIVGLILCLFGLFYIYDIFSEIKEIDQNFADFKQQNCAFVEQFSRLKQCQTLIAYKYKTIIPQNNKIKQNEYYVSFIEFRLADDQAKFSQWYQNLDKSILVNSDEIGLFSAVRPKKQTKILPDLTLYCLDENASCHGTRLMFNGHNIHQPFSYIVHGDVYKYWDMLKAQSFQCENNVLVDQKAMKQFFPYLYIPHDVLEYQYLLCWEPQRHLLRISLVMTTGYIR